MVYKSTLRKRCCVYCFEETTMRFALLSLVLVSVACGETKAVSGNDIVESTTGDNTADVDGSTDEDIAFDLIFVLDAESSIAGEAVGFSVGWNGDDGSTAEVTDYDITSDAEEPLTVSDDTITATLAAAHTLTLTATKPDGEAASATATLNVDAGPVGTLYLSLSETEVVAGESVTATISAEDEFGNDANSDGVVLTASDGVSIDGSDLLNTTAGTHTTTATLDDITVKPLSRETRQEKPDPYYYYYYLILGGLPPP